MRFALKLIMERDKADGAQTVSQVREAMTISYVLFLHSLLTPFRLASLIHLLPKVCTPKAG